MSISDHQIILKQNIRKGKMFGMMLIKKYFEKYTNLKIKMPIKLKLMKYLPHFLLHNGTWLWKVDKRMREFEIVYTW